MSLAGEIGRLFGSSFSAPHDTRGNNCKVVFLGADDYRRFLSVLGEVIERYAFLCHGYCLMGNHYHLLVETGHLAARQLNALLPTFNRVHGRSGHLFQAVMGRSSSRRRICSALPLHRPQSRARRSLRPTTGPGQALERPSVREERPAFLTTHAVASSSSASASAYRRSRRSRRFGAGSISPARILVASMPPEQLSPDIPFWSSGALRPTLTRS